MPSTEEAVAVEEVAAVTQAVAAAGFPVAAVAVQALDLRVAVVAQV